MKRGNSGGRPPAIIGAAFALAMVAVNVLAFIVGSLSD
jgi:hypothetical protein